VERTRLDIEGTSAGVATGELLDPLSQRKGGWARRERITTGIAGRYQPADIPQDELIAASEGLKEINWGWWYYGASSVCQLIVHMQVKHGPRRDSQGRAMLAYASAARRGKGPTATTV